MELNGLATEAGLSAKYLSIVWSALTDNGAEAGPLAVVRKMWQRFAGGQGRASRLRGSLRDLVVRVRRQLKPKVGKLHVEGISDGSQPFVLWADSQLAAGIAVIQAMLADFRKMADQLKDVDAEPTKNEPAQLQLRGLERFCAVFPDAFVISDRAPYFEPNAAGPGSTADGRLSPHAGIFPRRRTPVRPDS